MMKHIITIALLMCTLYSIAKAGQTLVGTQFTYQGELIDSGSPANGIYDLNIQLYNSPSGGTLIDTNVIADIEITNGLVNTVLDFGDMPFDGEESYLQINVRPGNSTGPYEPLSPRQRINTTPYAIQAEFTASGGASPWQENGGGISYNDEVIIGNAGTVTGSLFNVDTSGGQSPIRFKIDGGTKLIIRENGGLSVGINTSGVPDNGLYVNGKVRQPLDFHGFAKGAVTFVCGNQSTNILAQFNNENDSDFVIDSGLPEDGRCTVSVPFDITDSFISASASATNIVRGVSCGKTTSGGNDVIECNAYNPLSSSRVDAVVTLFLF